MIGKKVTVIAAVVAALTSSVVGATLLRSPDAGANDVTQTANSLIESAREELDDVKDSTIEVAEQALGPIGIGEKILLVVGARASSMEEAQRLLGEKNSGFGEVQGFYLAEARDYQMTAELVQTGPDTAPVACSAGQESDAALDCPDGLSVVEEFQPVTLTHETNLSVAFDATEFLLVSGFRTKVGAQEFLELARAAGAENLVVVQANKLGGGDIGLGQEAHPDGSGPLLGPLPNQEEYQL